MKKLLNLLASNRGRGAAVRAESSGESEATIYLYDVISDGWGISAAEFVRALSEIKADTIHLRINSPGGDVFDARAMKTALAQHPAKVVAHVDGLAASAASFVMLAADEIRIAKGAFVMIHKAWAFAIGNADDMDATAKLLRQIDTSLVGDYVAATGQAEADVVKWMAEETWFDAQQAVDLGFADELYDPDAKANALARFDLSAFERPPANYAAATGEDEIASAGAQQRATAERRLALYERTAPA